MMNYTTLQEVISKYKRDIKKHWELERYKWVAIKHFQDHWDIEAEDFAEMYKASISKTYNLLNSSMNFPGAQIYDFAKEQLGQLLATFGWLLTHRSDCAMIDGKHIFNDVIVLFRTQR